MLIHHPDPHSSAVYIGSKIYMVLVDTFILALDSNVIGWEGNTETHFNTNLTLRPNKKNKFRLTGLKILGWVGTHTFLITFFSEKKKSIILCILKGISPFKMHKIIYFPENLKKI